MWNHILGNKNMYNIKVFVECGEKGVGKTSYVLNKWHKNIFLQCDNPLMEAKTSSVLENALSSLYNKHYQTIPEIVDDLRKAVQDGYTVIIDNAEFINETILKLIINTIITINEAVLVFTFDIDHKYIYQCKVFRLLIEWDIILIETSQKNFYVSNEIFEKFIVDNLFGVSQRMIYELSEITNKNFNNLKKLIWLIKNKNHNLDKINDSVVAEYTYFLIEEKFSDLPDDLLKLLKKSSVIGKVFQKRILESSMGFNISGAKLYLEKLEKMNIFIRKYLNNEAYQFISDKMHTGILESIEIDEKIEWEKILLSYYLENLQTEKLNDKIIEHLIQITRLSESLNDYETIFFANKKLMYQYLKIKDIDKVIISINKLIILCKDHIRDLNLFYFVCFYKIKIYIKIGIYKEALDTINSIKDDYLYGSKLYVQYYYAKCLYGSGDVDQSYKETLNLREKLKSTSLKAIENQPIYALTYSLLATIQNHFGIGDNGLRYYTLALNHAANNLSDKAIYYDILKKYDMFFDYPFSKSKLTQSISYFESIGEYHEAAEVYLNMATEIMFNEENSAIEIKNYFDKAVKTFENIPNEKLAYARNNFAIFYIIFNNDIDTAASLFEKSLLVGLSSFTYMTIYLNLCMCYLSLYGFDNVQFKEAYQNFEKYNFQIKNRENATQYEDIYKKILDLIILERKKDEIETIKKIDDIFLGQVPKFFIPILEDIKFRNTVKTPCSSVYNDNKNFYKSLNENKIFLAEFRFWE